MLKAVRLALYALAALVLVLVIAGGVVSLFVDLNRFKPDLAELVYEETGRQVAIDGDIDLALFPRPRAIAHGVRLASVPGASAPDVVTVGALSVQVAWLPLVAGTLDARRIHAADVRIVVEDGADGRSSLDFEPPPRPEQAAPGEPVSLPDFVAVSDVEIVLREPAGETEIFVERAWVRPQGRDGPTVASATTLVNGTAVEIDASGGGLAALAADRPWPLRVAIRADEAEAVLEGTLSGLLSDAPRAELALSARGPTLAALSPLAGSSLPASDPFELTGRIAAGPDGARATDLRFAAGETVVTGTAALDLAGERPRIAADLAAPRLDVSNLLGAANAPGTADGGDGRLLSREPLPFAFLREIDFDLALRADSLAAFGIEFEGAVADVDAKDGLVQVERITATLPEGSLSVGGVLDARTAAATLSLAVDLSGVDVGEVLDGLDVPARSESRANATVKVASKGETSRALFDNLTADVRIGAMDVRFDDGTALALGEATGHLPGLDRPIGLSAQGRIRGQPLSATAELDPLTAYRPGAPYRFRIDATSGESRLRLEVDMNAASVEGLALDVSFEGTSLAQLSPLAGIDLPSVASYDIAGIVRFDADAVRLESARMRLGDSALTGQATLSLAGERPALEAAFAAETLDLDALMPDAPPRTERADGSSPPLGLSDQAIDVARFSSLDADLSLTAAMLRAGGQTFRDVDAQATLAAGALELSRFTAVLAEFPVSLRASLHPIPDGLEVEAAGTLRRVDLGAMVEEAGLSRRVTAGAADLTWDASSRGASPRDLFDNLAGELTVDDFAFTVRTEAAPARDVTIDHLVLSIERPHAPLLLEAAGSLGSEDLTIDASAVPLAELRLLQPIPLDVALRTPSSQLIVKGNAPDPRNPRALDFTVAAEGVILRELAYVAGLELAPEGPWRIDGRLTTGEGAFALRDFAMQIGESDVAGDAALRTENGETRGHIDARSTRFRLQDFLGEPAPEEEDEPEGADDRIFSREPLDLAALRSADVAIDVQVASFLGRVVESTDLALHARLADGVFRIERFAADLDEGTLLANASLDASGEVPQVKASLAADRIDLGALVQELTGTSHLGEVVSLPVDIDTELSGRGASPHDIAASLDGALSLTGAQGFIQQRAFGFVDRGLLRELTPWAGESDRTEINCFVSRFSVDKGIATARTLLLDAQNVTILGQGSIDLGREAMDLRLTPRPKEIRLLDLAVPVTLTGPMSDPAIRPAPVGTAKRVATTLGIFVNPLVLLVPVIEGVAADRNPCVEAMDRMSSGAPQNGGLVEDLFKGLGEGLGGVGRGLGRILGGERQ